MTLLKLKISGLERKQVLLPTTSISSVFSTFRDEGRLRVLEDSLEQGLLLWDSWSLRGPRTGPWGNPQRPWSSGYILLCVGIGAIFWGEALSFIRLFKAWVTQRGVKNRCLSLDAKEMGCRQASIILKIHSDLRSPGHGLAMGQTHEERWQWPGLRWAPATHDPLWWLQKPTQKTKVWKNQLNLVYKASQRPGQPLTQAAQSANNEVALCSYSQARA